MKMNTTRTEPVLLESNKLEEVESFTYLSSIINVQGGTDDDVKTRIGKARAALLQLQTILISTELSQRIKNRIFNSKVKPVLLYGAEMPSLISSCLQKNLESSLVKQDQPVRKHKADPSRRGNRKKEMGMDRAHAEEANG